MAVAYAVVPAQAVYSAHDEGELVLAGFVTFFDPPMEGVAEALRALRRDGVVVKILTGDNELVAQHVCGQVGLDSARIVGGDEIERMTDSALAVVAEQRDRLRPRLTRAEDPDHSRAQESQSRRRLPGRRYQRRALHPHGGRRCVRRDGR